MACDVSSSGDEMLFGSAAGYLHLWTLSAAPCVNQVCGVFLKILYEWDHGCFPLEA